jgi:hypothetical protein
MEKITLLLPKSLLYWVLFGLAAFFVHPFFIWLSGIAGVFMVLGMVGLLFYAPGLPPTIQTAIGQQRQKP